MKKIKAKMLVDFENPLSIKYAHYVKDSWIPLYDIIDIEFVQCVTPTHPDFGNTHFVTNKVVNNTIGEPKSLICNHRSFTEIAILTTYYKLWQQLADGEEFIMLEHDAFLREGHANTVRDLLLNRHEYKYLCFGSAVEAWWVNQQVAKNLVALAMRDCTHIIRGPMWYLEMAGASEPVRSGNFEVRKFEQHDIYNYRPHFQHWVDTGVIDLLSYDLKVFWPYGKSSNYRVPLSYIGRCALIYKDIDIKNEKGILWNENKHLPEEYTDLKIVSRPVVQAVDVEVGISNMRYENNTVRPASDYGKGSGGLSVDLNKSL